MSSFQIRPLLYPLRGEISSPADKSVTHRAIIISAVAKGKTTIKNFAVNDDCLTTINALRRLGIEIAMKKSRLIVLVFVLRSLKMPPNAISAGNSGTTMRLLLGVLSGQNFPVTLVADESLSKRPMLRVIEPLQMMGAKINATCHMPHATCEKYPPITIEGGNLKPIAYKMPLASAQIKSAVLLAGLYCKGTTKITEKIKTRDHTERMLKLFGADIKIKGDTISINGNKELVSPSVINIPGDISSASFFIVAASIIAGSRLVIKDVGLNHTRIGIIRVLKRMGADIKIQFRLRGDKIQSYEPMADLIVKSSQLKGTAVKKEEIPSLIDELPILMVAACYARGRTIFEGVEELRVKETDRVNSMVSNLNRMGADIRVRQINHKSNIIIKGAKHLIGAKVRSFGDHRTAMSMIIAGLKAACPTIIDDVDCINKSFPEFLKTLRSLQP